MSEHVTLSVQFACRKNWRVHCCWIKLNLDADKRAHLCDQRFCVCLLQQKHGNNYSENCLAQTRL